LQSQYGTSTSSGGGKRRRANWCNLYKSRLMLPGTSPDAPRRLISTTSGCSHPSWTAAAAIFCKRIAGMNPRACCSARSAARADRPLSCPTPAGPCSPTAAAALSCCRTPPRRSDHASIAEFISSAPPAATQSPMAACMAQAWRKPCGRHSGRARASTVACFRASATGRGRASDEVGERLRRAQHAWHPRPEGEAPGVL
jgi:hypothetical protein